MLNKFRNDRGPAKHFHGRKEIISTFERALAHHKTKKKGTTFLIQGAPGAGKTALLDKLSTEALTQNWQVATIKVKDLHNPTAMAQSLGESYVIDKQYAANVGIHGLSGGYTRNVAGYSSVEGLLKELSPENGLVLVFDEAQHLLNLTEIPDAKSLAVDTLDEIHNGHIGRPVMLLAAGLGTAEAAFNALGVSRFYGGCLVRLGGLGAESTRAIIQDWLTLDGMAKGDSAPWVNAIAEQVHGWPHHIMSYVIPAVEYLESNNGQMTAEGLEFVLASGHEFKLEYYDTRSHDIDEDQREALARSVIDVPLGETITRPAILDSMKQGGLSQKDADAIFKRALEQGVIDKRERGRYGIPIPSMHTWLVEEYGRDKDKERDSHRVPKALPSGAPKQVETLLKEENKSPVKGKGKKGGPFSPERY